MNNLQSYWACSSLLTALRDMTMIIRILNSCGSAISPWGESLQTTKSSVLEVWSAWVSS
jgi:hypothetical protein